MKLTGQVFSQCCAAVLLLGLSGCAAIPPKTVEIRGVELKQEARGKLSRFLGQSCVNAVDSDVQLSWRAYGQEKIFSATRTVARPICSIISSPDSRLTFPMPSAFSRLM